MNEKNRWFVGVDWGSEVHQVCVIDERGQVIGEKAVSHSGQGLTELTAWLTTIGQGEPTTIHVAIETTHGAVVETLLERSFVVYAINPKQLDRFRDRFTVAGAKDDRRDAYVLADSLRTDPHCYRRLRTENPILVQIRKWSRTLDDLKQERVRLGNRLWGQLQRYYPQMLQLPNDVMEDWFLSLWEHIPTPEKAAKVRKASVQRLLKKHRIRRIDAAHVLEVLRQEPLTVAPGTTEAARDHIKLIVEQLRVINRQLKQANRRLDRLCADLCESDDQDELGQKCEQHDVEILSSLPGVGRIALAVLLAEAPRAIEERDYHTLRALCGVAPVTRQSGKRRVVVMRRACNPRLREAVYHWARVATIHDPRSKEKYAALRSRGQNHGRALRSVADRLLAVMCAMLREGTLFDVDRCGARKAA